MFRQTKYKEHASIASMKKQEKDKRRIPGGGRQQVEIVYEDDDIVAVEKPAGIPVIAVNGGRSKSLLDIVSAHIQKRNPKGRAAVVHRLDRDTSGIMIFAKNARAKTALMGSWNDLVKKRLYTALVEGSPEADEGTLDSWLLEIDARIVRQVAPGTNGAMRALTHFKVLERLAGYTVLELELETGRRHQIRVQLAAIGCPVSGDERYGARQNPLERLCLHASLLEFQMPFKGSVLVLESPAPANFFSQPRQRFVPKERKPGKFPHSGSDKKSSRR